MNSSNHGQSDAYALGTDQYLYQVVQREHTVRRAWLVFTMALFTAVAAFIATV